MAEDNEKLIQLSAIERDAVDASFIELVTQLQEGLAKAGYGLEALDGLRNRHNKALFSADMEGEIIFVTLDIVFTKIPADAVLAINKRKITYGKEDTN